MAKPLLSVRNLTLDIPVGGGTLHAVRGIDFDLDRGETLCIVGESGSGKSLTSLALMGLLGKTINRSADRMDFDGTDLLRAKPRTMRALRRVRGQPSALLGCPPKRSENTPDLPCWRRRTGLAGLYICVAAAPFGAVGALGGFALTIVATLLVWP